MRPSNERIAEGISLLQAQTKRRAYAPGQQATGRGDEGHADEVVPASVGWRRLRTIRGRDGHGGSVTGLPPR